MNLSFELGLFIGEIIGIFAAIFAVALGTAAKRGDELPRRP